MANYRTQSSGLFRLSTVFTASSHHLTEKTTDLYFLEQLQTSYISVDWFSYEMSFSFARFSPTFFKCRRFDDNLKYEISQKSVPCVLRSFMRNEAPKNYLKMSLFSYFCSFCAKGSQKLKKKMADKIIREEIHNWGFEIFIITRFSV